MEKILIIQTAFIGDVVLATSLLEIIHQYSSTTKIDILVRKGNDQLFVEHPFINEVLIWNKKSGKYKSLFSIFQSIRKRKYDAVINCHRFTSSGFLTAFSGAKIKIGFNKNPLSFLFTSKIEHKIGEGHEVDRNAKLLEGLSIPIPEDKRPKLYPSKINFEHIPSGKFVCIAPSSVWKTKALPTEKWVELIQRIPEQIPIYILGGPNDREACQEIILLSKKMNIKNKAGEMNLLESAAWMSKAQMNYVNDSAPLHLASAMNAPVTAFFCSTSPSFGFTPLSDFSFIIETEKKLPCKPCGLHGKKECPLQHFNCGDINLNQIDF